MQYKFTILCVYMYKAKVTCNRQPIAYITIYNALPSSNAEKLLWTLNILESWSGPISTTIATSLFQHNVKTYIYACIKYFFSSLMFK